MGRRSRKKRRWGYCRVCGRKTHKTSPRNGAHVCRGHRRLYEESMMAASALRLAREAPQ